MKRYLTPLLLGGLLILLILSMVFAPRYAGALGNAILALFLAFALFMIIRHRLRAHQRGETTRSQMILRIFLDVLGLALAFTLATLLGKLAGDWGAAYGLWAGILTGCVVCLITAMAVMKIWRVFFR
jgi:O-antigen/teichoic acid export membrane protein